MSQSTLIKKFVTWHLLLLVLTVGLFCATGYASGQSLASAPASQTVVAEADHGGLSVPGWLLGMGVLALLICAEAIVLMSYYEQKLSRIFPMMVMTAVALGGVGRAIYLTGQLAGVQSEQGRVIEVVVAPGVGQSQSTIAGTSSDTPTYFGVSVAATKEALSTDPDSSVWSDVTAYTVKLVAQQQTLPHGGGSVGDVSVKALQNGKQVAFRLEWDDATMDSENGVDSYRDSAAIQFPLRPNDGVTSPFMGDEKHPVNIWQWRADWQADAQGKRDLKRETAPQGFHYAHTDASILKKEFPYKQDKQASAEEFIAAGFGTLTKQTSQNVTALGHQRDGKWVVVFVRDLKTGDEDDASFKTGSELQINFAIWDGREEEVNGLKSVSLLWVPLRVEAEG